MSQPRQGFFRASFSCTCLSCPGPQRREAWCLSPALAQGSEPSRGVSTKHHWCLGAAGSPLHWRGGGLFGWCRPVIFVISLSCQTRQTRSHPDIRGSFSPFCLRTRENRLLFHRRVSHSLEQASRCFATACEGLGIKNGSFEQKGIQKEKLFLKFKLQLHPLTG